MVLKLVFEIAHDFGFGLVLLSKEKCITYRFPVFIRSLTLPWSALIVLIFTLVAEQAAQK